MSDPVQRLDRARPSTDWPEIPSLDEREVIAQSARLALESCAADIAIVFFPDEDRRLLEVVSSAPPGLTVDPVPIDGDHLSAKVFREQTPLVVEDVGQHPVSLVRAESLGLASLLIVPIVDQASRFGCLVLGNRRRRRFPPADVGKAEATARYLALSLEKARHYREATERIADLSVLQEVATAVSGGEELGIILSRAAERLTGLLDATSCFVFLVDPKTGDGHCAAASSLRAEIIHSLRIKAGATGSISMNAVRERRPIAIYDALRDPRANTAWVERFGEKSLLAVPMVHRGNPIGALVFDETRAHRRFTELEIDRVLAVASHLAATVENARLNEDLRRSFAELESAQARLVSRERLAALGELAAAVAHEIRNPLGAIFNALDGLHRRLKSQGEVAALVSILDEEADRINRIIGDLIDFAKPKELTVDLVPIAEVIEEAVRATTALPGIDFALEVEPGIERVPTDQRQLRQALLNVFSNAIQAMGERGLLRVRVRRGEWSGRPAVVIDV
ncbi:MAG: GAF domain-containing protein, partial [Deltaproteobacteria bacterium]